LSQIYHSVKKDTGKSVGDWARDLKIKKAVELLLNTDMHIIDISRETGYTSVQGFIKTFKKEKGLTPKEFRNKNL